MIEQEIQKWSVTDGQHAPKGLITIQAAQCLNSDLVLKNLYTVLLFGTVTRVNLSSMHVFQQHAFTSTHWTSAFCYSFQEWIL